ncbi:UNVERIFIED_CONTAM: hypothetical protein Sradi_3854900 [Sesamum radiatum]|uniref:Uncharacterized protein n=1 Tax=Sesamum radiatum TaxID=300843 RepID=A0AAW2Q1F2_SESRA
MRHLSRQSKRPWLSVGDFNELLHHHEKQGGNPRAQRQIEDFRQCPSDCELHDMGFLVEPFTWIAHAIAAAGQIYFPKLELFRKATRPQIMKYSGLNRPLVMDQAISDVKSYFSLKQHGSQLQQVWML